MILLLASLAFAQDYAPIKKGQPSPIDGTVLTAEAMATIIAKGDADIATCKEEAKFELKKQQIECELDTQKLEYDVESIKKTDEQILKAKQEELDKVYGLVKKQNRNLTPVWIGVGFAAGLATSFGTIYVYEELTND
jgi:hypothetical protein